MCIRDRSLQHFRHYLLGTPILLRTDHQSLKWLHSFKNPEGMMARWLEILQEFDITVEHRPGRQHSNVDGMSRPFFKQCWGKTSKRPWVDQAIEGEELERADEVAELLGQASGTSGPDHYFFIEEDISSPILSVGRITFVSSIPDNELAIMQTEDPDLGPVTEWLRNQEIPTFDDLRSYSLTTRKLWDLVPMVHLVNDCLLYTSPSPRDRTRSRMPSSA